MGIITRATFDRQFVMLVLGAIAVDDFNLATVSSDRDRESDDIIASSDKLEVIFCDTSFWCCSVEKQFYLFQETGLKFRITSRVNFGCSTCLRSWHSSESYKRLNKGRGTSDWVSSEALKSTLKHKLIISSLDILSLRKEYYIYKIIILVSKHLFINK